MNNYRTIVVGTDGSALAGPTVARAALAARREDADLVIVCAFAEMTRRLDAKNVATLGGDARMGQVPGRAAASTAIAEAVAIAQEYGATIGAALLVDGDPAAVLVNVATEREAQLIVVGARHHRSLAERLLGTVATEVTKRAPCDVLVVRPAEETGELEVPEDHPATSAGAD
ncbi:universal stress protein [Mycolicibacterium brumae]|uniref:Universal stress protein n=1 Tax=Mycolicibacterium brumae TaxID=85968 RepID=A0A2G5P7I9_9MYCO|nr:universal stress protein [Mycolicibacterium brumae]